MQNAPCLAEKRNRCRLAGPGPWAGSAFSPIPNLNVPDMTVTDSIHGWVWGAILYPAGSFKRKANPCLLTLSGLTSLSNACAWQDCLSRVLALQSDRHARGALGDRAMRDKPMMMSASFVGHDGSRAFGNPREFLRRNVACCYSRLHDCKREKDQRRLP
jgi:hypothetical protein